MGRGGMGCASSTPVQEAEEKKASPAPVKTPATAVAADAPPPSVEAKLEATLLTDDAPTVPATCSIIIVYYSMYGHVSQLATALAEGINGVPGCSAKLLQVPEILPQDVLEKMHAPPKSDVPIATPEDLSAADGLVFGFPTRFGMMCSQMKSFFDATGGLWQTGALAGKPVTAFTSTGTQGGGQETTLLTAATQFVHHGMIYVPPGYSGGAAFFGNDEVRGGSAYGAGTFAGADGSQQPSETELVLAVHQGKYFAGKAIKLSA